jgi:RNA polymerase sigma-70 factor (ECF subfamily)
MDMASGWSLEGEGRTDAQAASTDLVGRAYEVFGPVIQGHLRALTRDPEAAADLTQEAFLRLHVVVGEGRPPDDIRAWLYTVASNLATSRGRRAQVAARHAAMLLEGDDTRSAEQLVVDRERDATLRVALASLSERDRELLLLAASGVTGPELAERLGRTQLATRTLLCRSRAKLRALVSAAEGAAA